MNLIFILGKTLVLREGAMRVARRLRDENRITLENENDGTSVSKSEMPKDNARIVKEFAEDTSIEDSSCISGLFDDDENEESLDGKITGEEKYSELGQDQDTSEENNIPNVYFISLLATDAQNIGARGIPSKAHYLFDIKTEMELKPYGIKFLSAQDLALHYKKSEADSERIKVQESSQETPFFSQNKDGTIIPTVIEPNGQPNIYTMAESFIEKAERDNPGGFYFFDEVPLIKGKI